jgi:cardiolipin synthase
VRVFLSGPGGGYRLQKRYLAAIRQAQRVVAIAHAYFLPSQKLVRTLRAAADRGIAVTLLLPGQSDVPIARVATRHLYRRLFSAGMRIFEWQESVLHAKAAVIDGRLVSSRVPKDLPAFARAMLQVLGSP